MGWNKSCEPQKLTSCEESSFQCYKVDGVDHFMSKFFTAGVAMKEKDSYDLKTLTKVALSIHVGYIKAPNH
ncbi:hypothetical protein L3X38_023170 [Prunus dulcis]|uniref:Uncharacterized protein n=1 Tax=Prunus dulcis TaxID=3755 RepID=A0AAD4Z505_PRUDU|nr:hypothetical protein L3X38_023170 [Prunus dulcis]